MKKKILIAYIGVLFVSMGITFAYSFSQDVFFTTPYGAEFTKAQFDNLRRVFTTEEISNFRPGEVDDIKDITDMTLDDKSEIIVETRTYYDENNQPIKSVHREITEAEARGIPCLPENRLLYGWSK